MSAQIATNIEKIATLAFETFDSISYMDLDLAYSCLRQNLFSKICELLEEAYVSPGTNVKLQSVRDLLQAYQEVMDETVIDRYDCGPVETKLSIRRMARFTTKILVKLLVENEMQQHRTEKLPPYELFFRYPDDDLSAFPEGDEFSEDVVGLRFWPRSR